jgi:Ser/Thr protein kinase RdoA (MazF antagonist)
MRLANLLVDGPRTVLLDFDDFGFGWFMYDLGAALSFIDRGPDAPALRAAWLDGYAALRPLAPADLEIIDAMVLLRRMVLLAWIGTHGETQLAQAHAQTFAADTAMAGRAWLDQR